METVEYALYYFLINILIPFLIGFLGFMILNRLLKTF
jgi:hypothetical protein